MSTRITQFAIRIVLLTFVAGLLAGCALLRPRIPDAAEYAVTIEAVNRLPVETIALQEWPTLTPLPTSKPTVTATPTSTTMAHFLPVVAAQQSLATPAVQNVPGQLVIVALDKLAEYTVIENIGGKTIDLEGWVLRSEKGAQDCSLRDVVIGAGGTLVISAMGDVAGYNCGFEGEIWNNSEYDPAVLLSPNGQELHRFH